MQCGQYQQNLFVNLSELTQSSFIAKLNLSLVQLCPILFLYFLLSLVLAAATDLRLVLRELFSLYVGSVAGRGGTSKDGLYQALHTNTIPNTILEKNCRAIPIPNTNTILNLYPQLKLSWKDTFA